MNLALAGSTFCIGAGLASGSKFAPARGWRFRFHWPFSHIIASDDPSSYLMLTSVFPVFCHCPRCPFAPELPLVQSVVARPLWDKVRLKISPSPSVVDQVPSGGASFPGSGAAGVGLGEASGVGLGEAVASGVAAGIGVAADSGAVSGLDIVTVGAPPSAGRAG